MPANLSPEFKDAQQAYREAREPKERLECLREMLRTLPKHKGTEHLQADIRTRIKEVTEEISAPRKPGARTGPAVTVRPEGAAQVALLGPPNVGKSSLHARLTASHAPVGPYPFTTRAPLPGMLPYEDVQFQLVDLPPVSAASFEGWMTNALQCADGALLVLDLTQPDCVDQLEAIRARLLERGLTLLEGAQPVHGDESGAEELFRMRLPTALLASKSDLLSDPAAELEAFRQLTGTRLPAVALSVETGHGLGTVGRLLFDMLGVLRVYTKVPGHAVDKQRPFTLLREGTVRDVARLVHRGRAAELRFARLWGSGKFDGEQVSADHPLRDGDLVELHW